MVICKTGTSGWSYKHWKGKFYPQDLPQKDWFKYYCKNFDTVEVNSSFYRWPTEAFIRQWYEKSPYGFKFTLKAPQLITHLKQLKNTDSYIKRFYALTSGLKQKTGCHLFQLPPSFLRTEYNEKKLLHFVRMLDGRKHNVIEFRDKSWWHPCIYSMLDDNHVTFCSVMGLNMPSDIIRTNNIIYVRFHGEKYATDFSEVQIRKIAQQIKREKCRHCFIYFNNDTNAYAPKNALQMRGEFNA